ncbi:MAG: GNAT family N-acetyltransferase [Polyangiales bacterium]
MTPPATRPLRPEERAAAVDTLAASFDDDPWFRWVLPGAEERRAWVAWFHGVSVARALGEGTAFTLDGGPSLGAISVMPPGVDGPRALDWVRALRSPPRRPPTRRLAFTGLRTQARLDALHPREPVVYVHVLGVHPSQKGHGLGGALLREALAMAARGGVPLFLETSNPVNLGFYRRFGLRVRAEIDLDGAPPVWTLQTDGPPPMP